MKRVVITGASGLLGWNLCRLLPRKEVELFGIHLHHPVNLPGVEAVRTDLRDRVAVAGLIGEIRPDAVIHAAALSDADYCQSHPEESHAINAETPVHLASLCRAASVPYLFISSDLVFDGLKGSYREGDQAHSRSRYGKQKLLAEEGVLKTYPEAVVCRLPLLIGIPGPGGKGILPMLRAMREGKPLRLFVDEYRTPLTTRSAVAGLLVALERARGILHLGGPERISRYDLGRLIAELFGEKGAALVPCRQRDVTTPAPRPPDVSLDSSKAIELGFRPLPLLEQLRELCNEYLKSENARGLGG